MPLKGTVITIGYAGGAEQIDDVKTRTGCEALAEYSPVNCAIAPSLIFEGSQRCFLPRAMIYQSGARR